VGAGHTLEDIGVIQRNLSKLEERASKKRTKFNSTRGEVLQLGWDHLELTGLVADPQQRTRGPGGQQAGCESAVCPGSTKGQTYSELN